MAGLDRRMFLRGAAVAAGGAVLGADVPVGVPVRVTGVLQPGILTTCQQGTPIRVTRVRRR